MNQSWNKGVLAYEITENVMNFDVVRMLWISKSGSIFSSVQLMLIHKTIWQTSKENREKLRMQQDFIWKH